MKKRIIVLLTISALCAAIFGACGSKTSSDASAAAASSSASSSSSSETASEGETIDTGVFKVTCPDGWYHLVMTDVFGEEDEDGNYPVDPESVGLIKGGESDLDSFSKPTIYIYYTGSEYDDSSAELSKAFYDSCEDIDVTINGVKCTAFNADMSTYDEDDDSFYKYTVIFYPISDSAYLNIIIPVDMIDYEGVTIDDADVQTIINSIELD